VREWSAWLAAEMRTAILGHAQYSGVPRVTHLDKALFAATNWPAF